MMQNFQIHVYGRNSDYFVQCAIVVTTKVMTNLNN